MYKEKFVVFRALTSRVSFVVHGDKVKGVIDTQFCTLTKSFVNHSRLVGNADNFYEAVSLRRGDFFILSGFNTSWAYSQLTGRVQIRIINQSDEGDECYFCRKSNCVWNIKTPPMVGGSWGIGCPDDSIGKNFAELGESFDNIFVLDK